MSQKDRHLSKPDYLDKLQKEYFINEVKGKTYTHYKDRAFYEKVMRHKKEKIEGLTENLGGVVNIFNDEETREHYKTLIYPIKGLPQFEMTSEEIELYYAPEVEVVINMEDGKKRTGKIIYAILDKNIAHVKVRGEEKEQIIHLTNITRILN